MPCSFGFVRAGSILRSLDRGFATGELRLYPQCSIIDQVLDHKDSSVKYLPGCTTDSSHDIGSLMQLGSLPAL